MTTRQKTIRYQDWEAVIGLETHIQLATQSKLFSSSPTHFGQSPNSQVSFVDLGLPGTLPVLNKAAIEFAIRFGLAINAEISNHTEFARKNYFYPDLPKGYQTTQMSHPIIKGGYIAVTNNEGCEKKIRIHHAHLEEDAGKSSHDKFADKTSIDLNRAGIPLLEVVSEPDIRSTEEAIQYLKYIHSLIRYLKISDGDLSQGSLRCDVNISVRPKGQQELGTRTELKNLNSFRFIERAIKKEQTRQINALTRGQTIIQETRLYDPEKDETYSMRRKEEALDYRYFPCPDLPAFHVAQTLIDTIKNNLPELPYAKYQRYINDFKLTHNQAQQLIAEPEIADYFEQSVQHNATPKLAANWILGDISGYLNSQQITIDNMPFSAELLSQVIHFQEQNVLSSKGAKTVFETICLKKVNTVKQAIETFNLTQLSDNKSLENFVCQVIEKNSEQVNNYLQASEDKRAKMLGFFVGKVMQLSKGSANPKLVNEILQEKLREKTVD